jgi:hypothetical protein
MITKRMDLAKFNKKVEEGQIMIGGLGNPQGVRITKITKKRIWFK